MNKTTFTPGADQKSMTIERDFNAPLSKVWQAWTTQDLLEQWWAPAPWKAVTKEFDFSEGGRWLYAMRGPEGEEHWSLEEYQEISEEEYFVADDYFSDEEGNPNTELPGNNWRVEFTQNGEVTHLTVKMKLKSAEDLEKLTEMGFKEGFTQGLDQLEELLVRDN